MAFLVISGLVAVVGVILHTLAPEGDKGSTLRGWGGFLIGAAACFAFIILLIAGISWADRNYDKTETLKEYQYYTALYENEVFAENEEMQYELICDIIAYNEKVENIQSKMGTEWFNIFYPESFWKGIQVIELSSNAEEK